ncbi:MAG: hypothetical protein H0X22_00750 [Acidimicrobiia bacterium]|nr:hypothetical protein [Acidimicrobiia bacterium]
MTTRVRHVAVAAGIAGVLFVSACSNDTETYKVKTEKFIEDAEMGEANDTSFSDATCDEPESIDVGTTYTCTAVAEDGSTWDFDAEIDGENSFVVTDGTKRE